MTGHAIVRTVAMAASAALLLSAIAAPTTAAKPKCAGKVATIVGTKKADVIKGTRKADVIVARGGNDKVRGRGGDDTICGGGGKDTLYGNGGKDKLRGEAGNDTLFGGSGRDKLFGNDGNDKLWGNTEADWLFGGTGRDRLEGQGSDDALDGGPAIDVCRQGVGSGRRVRCELPVPLAPPPKVFAVAYSDLDGQPGFSDGDVLISKLVDANGDGVANHGDTIILDKYPISLTPTVSDFADWGVKSHTVKATEEKSANRVIARSMVDDVFIWSYYTGWEAFEEQRGASFSFVQDGRNGTAQDAVFMQPTSPSVPGAAWRSDEPVNTTDDRLVDVELNY